MYEEYLMHYGVLGMRWGVRRAAKYVHAKRKQRQAERARLERERILKSPRKLRKNISKFSPQEVEAAINRFSQEQRLRDLSKSKMATGKQKVDIVMSYLTTGAKSAYIIGNGLRFVKRVVNNDRSGAMNVLREMSGQPNQKDKKDKK